MQFILLPSVLMALATTIAALPSPSSPIIEIQTRNDQAATLNIAPDPDCRDYNYVAAADGECYYMGGNSVSVWETQGDCRVWFASDRDCIDWTFKGEEDTCYDGSNIASYQVFCG